MADGSLSKLNSTPADNGDHCWSHGGVGARASAPYRFAPGQTAIQRVPGVKSVKVDYRTKAAVVMFDATKTTPDVIAAASTNVGYPARVTRTGS